MGEVSLHPVLQSHQLLNYVTWFSDFMRHTCFVEPVCCADDARARVLTTGGGSSALSQGYLAHKKTPPLRTLQ